MDANIVRRLAADHVALAKEQGIAYMERYLALMNSLGSEHLSLGLLASMKTLRDAIYHYDHTAIRTGNEVVLTGTDFTT